MAQMIPTEIFYGKEYDTESGAEMALFKIIKNEPNRRFYKRYLRLRR